jgi:D-beta-D-heptose 7-phosphate kinase / D-beta-D-heptose 1-phosphate adenosyltransferase
MPPVNQLRKVVREIEDNWQQLHLLVVGDVMLDKYIWGEVTRISPEAPVPVVRATRRSSHPGGAANVALNIARLGAHATVVGFTGGDDDERQLCRLLGENSVDTSFIACEGFPTIAKLRVLGGSQQMLRLDQELVAERGEADYARLLDAARTRLEGADALVLSDYAKGTLSTHVCHELISAARVLGIPVLVDPKNSDFSRYRAATTICPNRAELAAAARLSVDALPPLLTAGEAMVRTFDLEFLTATLGEHGIALLRPGSRFHAPAQARQVFDVSGAGDAVIAVLALGLASGLRPETAVELANTAAAIVVGKVGTAPVEKHELLAALAPQLALEASDKILSRAQLLSRAALWRANAQRIVFTNGCFDLLHIGHITLLEEARRFGDRLVVGINTDSSVRALKGPSRPIVGERERARVLAALAAVDAVVAFDEPTPLALITELKPDVLVKGGDYATDSIVGAEQMRLWGGQVQIVPFVAGHSTTSLLARSASA